MKQLTISVISVFLSLIAVAVYAVDSDLTVVRHGKSRLLKEADLRKLPAVEIVTALPGEGARTNVFRGPLLESITGPLGADEQIEIQALNDYVVTIPAAKIRQYRPILAYSVNDETLTYDKKGPLRIIFDYSKPENAELRKKTAESLYVWYVAKLIVR